MNYYHLTNPPHDNITCIRSLHYDLRAPRICVCGLSWHWWSCWCRVSSGPGWRHFLYPGGTCTRDWQAFKNIPSQIYQIYLIYHVDRTARVPLFMQASHGNNYFRLYLYFTTCIQLYKPCWTGLMCLHYNISIFVTLYQFDSEFTGTLSINQPIAMHK